MQYFSYTKFIQKFMPALSLILWLSLTNSALAQEKEKWLPVTSESKIFTSRLPEDYTKNTVKLYTDLDRYALSEEYIATVESEEAPEKKRTYIIKFSQTPGVAVSLEDLDKILSSDFAFYFDAYKKFEAVVKKREKKNDKNNLNERDKRGAVLYFEYIDPKDGLLSFRMEEFITDFSKIQQIYIGPPEDAFSYLTDNFFNSMILYNGLSRLKKIDPPEWTLIESQRDKFTARAPKTAAPFLQGEQRRIVEQDSEFIGHVFFDPVRRESFFYNLYSYSFKGNLNYTDAQNVLISKHISKYRQRFIDNMMASEGIEFEKREMNGYPAIYAEYPIDPFEKFPYVNNVKLHVGFHENHMIVQEVMASPKVLSGSFIDLLFKNVVFHPDGSEALKAMQNEEASLSPPADSIAVPSEPPATP